MKDKGERDKREEEVKGEKRKEGNVFMQEIFAEHLPYTSLYSKLMEDRVPALEDLFF
jgi:hypothetical protein